MCCRPRPFCAARPICCWPRARPASRSTSRRASSSRRGTCRMSRPRSPRPATSRSCFASAARASATTRWSSTCAPCRSWRGPAIRWCSTRRTPWPQPGGLGDRSGGEREFGPGAGPRRGRGRRRRGVHRDPPGPRPCALRRPDDAAAARTLPALLETLIAFDRIAKARPQPRLIVVPAKIGLGTAPMIRPSPDAPASPTS